MFYWTKEQEKI